MSPFSRIRRSFFAKKIIETSRCERCFSFFIHKTRDVIDSVISAQIKLAIDICHFFFLTFELVLVSYIRGGRGYRPLYQLFNEDLRKGYFEYRMNSPVQVTSMFMMTKATLFAIFLCCYSN